MVDPWRKREASAAAFVGSAKLPTTSALSASPCGATNSSIASKDILTVVSPFFLFSLTLLTSSVTVLQQRLARQHKLQFFRAVACFFKAMALDKQVTNLGTVMDDRSKQMLTGPPIPLLVKMSAPNSLAFLIQASVSMAEIWFIGRLGSLSLAAIALVFPLLMLTQTLSGGAMGGAVASAIARALGAGDLARAENLIWHAIALAGAGSLLLLALFLLVGDRFLGFMGGTGEILEQAIGYSLILFTGGICLWLVGVVSAVFRGMGNMRFPAAMMALSAILQIPLSGAMILGAFGLPGLGISGAAISAIVSALLLSAVMLLHLASGSGAIRLRLSALRFRKELFDDILGVALPGSISPVLTVLTIVLLTAFVGRFGEEALAGYGIGSRIEFLMISPCLWHWRCHDLLSRDWYWRGGCAACRNHRLGRRLWRSAYGRHHRIGVGPVSKRMDSLLHLRSCGLRHRAALHTNCWTVFFILRHRLGAVLWLSGRKRHALAGHHSLLALCCRHRRRANAHELHRSCSAKCILCGSRLYAGLWRHHDGCA
jgi:O-antigen/teichoic acid export membrane protein